MTAPKAKEFKVNKSLAYLVQQITNDSTQEILAYFFGIASFVADDVFKKSKATYVNKDIVLYYKKTPITFKIKMHCSRIQEQGHKLSGWTANVGFPTQTEDLDITDLMNKVVETGLGLIEEEEIEKFNRPMLKTPACLRSVRLAQDLERLEPTGESDETEV